MLSYKLLNASEIDTSDRRNHGLSAIQEGAERDDPYFNEMTLPQGTAFFAKSAVRENQSKPYVEIDCKPRMTRAYQSPGDDRDTGVFVSQTIVLSLYGFSVLQAATLKSRMIRYGLSAQNHPAIEDDILAAALREPEDAQAPQNTQAVLNEPVKIIAFDLCYWQEKNENPDRKTVCHANVTWSAQ